MNTPALGSVALTHEGRLRPHNEDCVHADAATGLFIVADGMGGHKAGEVASALVITRMCEIVEATLADTPSLTPDAAGALLEHAVQQANHTVYETARSDPRYSNMGTTLVAGLIRDQYIHIAHVGDSRLYRLRDGELECLTSDHSLVQEMVDRGLYTREQAARAANRNIVTRALGLEPEVKIERQQHPLEPSDMYLLCSDGLSDMIDGAKIVLTLHQFGDNLEKAAQALIDSANEAGGRDNISVVIALVGKGARSPD